MKIEHNQIPNGLTKAPQPTKATDGAAFKTHFERALAPSEGHPRAEAPITVVRSAPIGRVPLRPAPAEKTVVNALDDLLGVLETYQMRLGDGRLSLKMLENDLNRINERYRQLDALTRDFTVNNDLRSLLEEGLATAREEIERFERGDYC